MVQLIKKPSLWLVFLVFSAVMYVGIFAWSPSSYDVALQHIGVPDQGPDLGRARPIRSDEWSVLTPLFQATVNNGFHRINEASLYKEDLRLNYGLPLFDWGLAFKPTLWGFLALPPAYAYSMHWFLLFVLFIFGHAILFSRIGLKPLSAFLLSASLYFSGFSQFWWTILAPALAIFPWVIIVLLEKRLKIHTRLLLFYWISAGWLVTNLYPPVAISLAFVGAIFIAAWGKEWKSPKNFIGLIFSSAASAATIAYYLRDYLTAASSTLYPGNRNVGGGSTPWQELVSYLFPFSTFNWHFSSIIGQNICEVGTAATALTLMVLCFLDYEKFKSTWANLSSTSKFRFVLVFIGLLMMLAWMALPIPSSVGKILLWHQVQPERMEYAFGLLFAVGLAFLMINVGTTYSHRRLAALAFIVVAAWIFLKILPTRSGRLSNFNDLLVIAAAAPFLYYWRKSIINGETAILGASALAGMLAVGPFNPLQSTRPIFAKLDTPVINMLRNQQSENDGVLAIAGPGAVYNGLGFKSVAHVTSIPALEFWRKEFPDLPEKEFGEIFNRYSHIAIIDEEQPKILYADRIGVPGSKFLKGHILTPKGVAGDAHVPLWVSSQDTLTGTITPPKSGDLLGLGLSIGTGGATPTGILKIKLCRNKNCITTSRSLSESIDNTYFPMNFSGPIPVSEGEKIYMEVNLQGTIKPIAFWSYPEKSGEKAIHINNQTEEWNIKMDFRYALNEN